MTKELIEKYRNGDSLTDKEVRHLYDWYSQMTSDTQLLGERYQLMWRDLYDQKYRLDGYLTARGLQELPF